MCRCRCDRRAVDLSPKPAGEDRDIAAREKLPKGGIGFQPMFCARPARTHRQDADATVTSSARRVPSWARSGVGNLQILNGTPYLQFMLDSNRLGNFKR